MTERGTREGIGVNRMVLLHLVLTYHWYDETAHGSKRVEYRAMTPRWRKLIFDKRDEITHVRFARGYTATMQTYKVEKNRRRFMPYRRVGRSILPHSF
jgi:hypothetical protein